MDRGEQLDALYAEIFKVLDRFDREFDLDGPGVIWVLQCLIHDVSDIDLDFEAEIDIEDNENGD